MQLIGSIRVPRKKDDVQFLTIVGELTEMTACNGVGSEAVISPGSIP